MSTNQRPPTYKKWSQFDRICTCGKRKAILQRKYGDRMTKYLSEGSSLKDAKLRTLKEFNIKTICCLRDLTYWQKNFIYDNGIGAYTDITIGKGKKLNENLRSGNGSGIVGYEFLPMTNGEMPFNMNEYSMMLAMMQVSAFDKVEILRRDGTNSINSIPQFPNYRITNSQNMPTILSKILPRSNDELTLQSLNAN
jgi:hypothetical protein